MYRLTFMGSGWIAIKIECVEKDLSNCRLFVSEGSPVIYVDDLLDLPDSIDYEFA